MRATPSYSDYQPLGHMGRFPIYITTVLTALYVLGMVVTEQLSAAKASLAGLWLNAEQFFLRGWLWQPFTSTWLNGFTLFFLMGVLCFYTAGREVERYLGRGRFLKFYLLCLLVPALVLGGLRLLGTAGVYGGMFDVSFAMLVAFAALYPNIEYFGRVPLKHVVYIFLAVALLEHLFLRNWLGLSVLVAECAMAFGFVRYLQYGGSLEFTDLGPALGALKEKIFGPRRNFRVLPDPPNAVRGSGDEHDQALDVIDPLLEKIAKSGLASLTRRERQELEKARETLLKNESGSTQQ